MSRWGSLLLFCFALLISQCLSEKLRKNARSYSSGSSSSNLYGGSSSSSGDGYNDNFDSMFNSMDLNNNGKAQKIKISLPNPPYPPKPPRPMKAPNMGNYENDPNRMPHMPRPPAPPAGFGPMDIEFNFPSYEPSVDDSFFDSDQSGGSSGYGSSSSSNNNNGYGSSSSGGNSNYGSNSGSSNSGSSYASSTSASASGGSTSSPAYGSSTRYSAGSSSGSATTADPNANRSCSPKTQPAVTNGVCVSESQITAKCKNLQLAQSTNCKSGEFCCFSSTSITSGPDSASTTTASSGGGGSGSTTRPTSTTSARTDSVTPVSSSTLTSTGSSSTTSKASAGGSSTLAPSGPSTTSSSSSYGSSSTQATNGGACSPLSNPSVTNGQCFNLNALQANCRGIQMAKSNQCAFNQFCCFSSPNAATTTASSGQQPASSSSASPVTATLIPVSPAVTTTSTSTITTTSSTASPTTTYRSSSSSMTSSSSSASSSSSTVSNGGGSGSGSSTAAPGSGGSSLYSSTGASSGSVGNKIAIMVVIENKPCHPQGKVSAVVGQCIATANLPTQCSGKSVGFADACAAEEACCFSEPPKRSVCRPRSSPGQAASGECMPTSSLSSQCSNRAASKSDDCASQEWCCMGPSQQEVAAGAATGAATAQPSLQVQPPQISLLGTGDGQQSANSGIQVAVAVSGAAASGSSDVANKGPITVSVTSNNAAPSCTPNDNTAIHNGKCLTMRELSQQCVEKKASSSSDCSFGRFCCYSDDGTVLPAQQESTSQATAALINEANKVLSGQASPAQAVAALVASAPSSAKSCSPNSNKAVSNGVCMTIRELRASCVDEKASPSIDCDMGSWCCFSEDGKAVGQSGGVVSGQANKVALTEAPVAVVVVEATTVTAVTALPDGDQQCTPNSKPDISNGICLPTKDLRVRCKNQRVSKSPQCRLGHWCCFNDVSNPVSLTVNDFSRNINAL